MIETEKQLVLEKENRKLKEIGTVGFLTRHMPLTGQHRSHLLSVTL